MNILVIGIGSIGSRHLSNLLSSGYRELAVVSSKTVLPEAFQHLPVYKTITEAVFADHFDAAIICSPTALHAEQVLLLLQHELYRIYIEKPVSHSAGHIKNIIHLAGTYTNRIIVGYDLRFDPGYKKVCSLLSEHRIGIIVAVQVFAGQWLPQWRPYEDHRTGMSAQIATGGGVLLDLVHEFDYLCSLLGNIETVNCHTSNSGVLEIETEESADILLQFENGIKGTVHLDYLQPQLKRYAIFTGTAGTITWNLADRFVEFVDRNGQPDLFSYADTERNDRFKSIMQAFLADKEDDRFVYLADAVKSLQVVLAAKRSDNTNSVVAVRDIQF